MQLALLAVKYEICCTEYIGWSHAGIEVNSMGLGLREGCDDLPKCIFSFIALAVC